MTEKHQEKNSGHYIVAIGASAGGLEAIHEFFDNMPSNGNLSFIIIQHLSPDYKSLLVELIAKHTNMKVFEAGQGMKVEKNCVYVIPNNKLLSIRGGSLELGVKSVEKAPNTAIDTFLFSLAKDQGQKAIAIILSGTGTDGSRGIERIHEEGGVVFVQDPVSAKFDGMPNSAINTGYTDFILAPELMPEEIFNYIKERPVHYAREGAPTESQLPEVLKLVEKNCSYDFSNYKSPTLLRRISRRMGLLGYKDFPSYVDFLKSSSDECKFLGKEFLIGVTKFFRDGAAFKQLREQILPDLINSKEDGEQIKIWVTACSTGEEAYSFAMLMDDLIQTMGKNIEVKIFATDIDPNAIEVASKGIYSSSKMNDIDEHLVNRYFTREGSMATIVPKLRKQIVFARHNVLKDPPFIKNDLVTCRNMLIYMNHVLQRKVLSTLQFSLNSGGILFLGPSEVPSGIKVGFDEINGKWKIFRKMSNDNSYNPDKFPSLQLTKTESLTRNVIVPSRDQAHRELEDDFRSVLTEEFGFAAIYIDKNFEIRDAVGDFKKYLSLPDRIVALNLLKMVGPDLSIALNTAIRKSLKENIKVNLNCVRIKQQDGKDKLINIMVKKSARDGYIMIVLGECHENYVARPNTEFSISEGTSAETSLYINDLEEELKETRSNLQMAVEGLETANEELQSSNEELLSANEELQSSNEELQSLNEELHTLNTEHQLRIRELIELNDDLNNYFRSTDLAQIFVDRNLRIRKFNPTAVKMVNLIEGDIGRPIEHISTNLRNPENFIEEIRDASENNRMFEKEISLNSGATYLMRILPYVRQDSQVDGVVITFIDISNIKELDNIIKGVFNSSFSAIMAFRSVRSEKSGITDFKWIASNYQSDALLKKQKDEYIGKSLTKVFPALSRKDLMEKFIQVVETGEPLNIETQIIQEGEENWYGLIATQMGDGLVLSLTDFNEKKKNEEKFRRNYYELMKTKENLRALNAELEEKISSRTFELSQSEERFRLIANATSDAIWDWDLVNNKVWWSDSFYARLGFEKEPDTENSSFWINNIHPEDRAYVQNEIHDAIDKGLKSWSARYRFKKADGTYALMLDRGTVLVNPDGVPYRMVGAMMDITEAEASEQRLRDANSELEKLFQEFKFVTDFMPQMVWSTKPDGFHDFYNKGWYDYTGLTAEESFNEGWSKVLHPHDFDKTLKVWKECLRTGVNYETEYRMKRHDGQYRWFLARALPLKNEEGTILKWFGTCTDIHDQKIMSDILEQRVIERTAELQRINGELESSNTELLQFASVASHDLKEPLRKIHMFSNLVKDRYLNTESTASGALDYINRIIAASARMTKLINDLLTFTRLSVTSSFEFTDLNTIVEEVLSDLELVISEKRAQIDVPDLPEAEIVTGQMRQVFQNIISNALKFSKPDSRPHIKISCEKIKTCDFNSPADPQGDYCRIKIEDNGIGFDNQYADKIFTIFQRLHARERYEGTGIGLAITRKIIERHNGAITAYSKEGEGSCFCFIIPLKQEVQVEATLN